MAGREAGAGIRFVEAYTVPKSPMNLNEQDHLRYFPDRKIAQALNTSSLGFFFENIRKLIQPYPEIMNSEIIVDQLLRLIQRHSGKTEMELATLIFGPKAYQQRVNSDCHLLISRGLVERRGMGGPSDPFRYFPTT